MIVRDTKPKHEKWVKRGRGLGHVTYLSNFGTPLISPERLKMQNSNFACRLKVRDSKRRNEKWVKRGVARSRDLLFKFLDPLIYAEWLKIQNSNLASRLRVRDT